MTESESVALRWIEKHLRSHRCLDCGGLWITRQSVGVIFHQCQPPHHKADWRGAREREDEERERWAQGLLGPIATALEDAVDDIDLLRRIESEEE